MGIRQAVFGESIGRTLVRGLSLALLILVASRTLVLPIRATGISMLPTYGDGQLLFFNALAYRLGRPARGDVVVIALDTQETVLVKRVIALPHERVRIDDGRVSVDGAWLSEPYVRNPTHWMVDEVALGADEYFVIGDNRSMSPANHTFGVVERSRLRARLLF